MRPRREEDGDSFMGVLRKDKVSSQGVLPELTGGGMTSHARIRAERKRRVRKWCKSELRNGKRVANAELRKSGQNPARDFLISGVSHSRRTGRPNLKRFRL